MYVAQDKGQWRNLLNMANGTSDTVKTRIFFAASDSAINIHWCCLSEELCSINLVASWLIYIHIFPSTFNAL